MSDAIYPSQIYGLTLKVVKAPEGDTLIQSAANKVELRLAQTENPIWHWSLTYEQLFNDLRNPNYTASELETLMGFYLARRYRFDDFLFDDPEDDSVTNQTLQLVNDGAGNYYTPLQRNMGGQFYEDVTDLNAQGDAHYFPLSGTHNKIFANGVQQSQSYLGNTGDFDLLGPGLAIPGYSFSGLYLKWHSAPTAPITGTFMFYFRVRFEQDRQDFEKFLYRLWTIGGAEGNAGAGMVKLVSARSLP